MKTKSKALLTLTCAIVLAVGSICGVMAYLTDNDQAVNTFTVGDIDITLDEENADKDTYGEAVPDRDKQNDYHLLPGLVYDKDPMVTVEPDSEDCYVRMMVTITESKAWDTLFANGNHTIADFLDLNSNDWTYITNIEDTAKDTRTYEFRYNKIVPAVSETEIKGTELPELFTTVTIPGRMTKEELALLEGFQMNLEAHAIQAAGFAEDLTKYDAQEAEAAWTAFEEP